MAVRLQAVLLMLAVLLVSGCGSEDSARSKSPTNSGVEVDRGESSHPTPQPTPTPPDTVNPGTPPIDPPPVTEPEPEPEPPVEPTPPVEPVPPVDPVTPIDPEPVEPEPPAPASLDTNIFFPVVPGMALYFDDNTEPTVQGESQRMGTDTVYPLQYADLLSNYFTSTAEAVGVRSVKVLALQQADPVYLEARFSSRRIILDDDSTNNTSGNASITITSAGSGFVLPIPVPVRTISTLRSSEWIDIPGFAPQPARHIDVQLQLVRTLPVNIFLWANPWIRPWVAPLFTPVTFDLWLVPGIGVVKAQTGGLVTQLQRVEGVTEPQVFHITRNADPDTVAAQILLPGGEAVTDIESTPTLYYRTAAQDWLQVEYGNGSWQVRLARSDLARGVHAATVRFGEGAQARDATVSLMVD